MKLVFIDEFKCETTFDSVKMNWYGLVAVIIDSYFYAKYKDSFLAAFKKLGWKDEEEWKGRYVFSKKGNSNIIVEKRLEFAEILFSSTKSKKNAVISPYVSFEIFNDNKSEEEKYTYLLQKIIKNIEQPIDKKGDKKVVAFFIDENSSLNKKNITKTIEDNLKERNVLFERPFFVNSDNFISGMIMADFVCYFHENFIRLKLFSNETKEEFMDLIKKLKNNSSSMSEKEIDKLNLLIIGQKKLKTSKEFLNILKKINYVK